jgi:hypothetical protein
MLIYHCCRLRAAVAIRAVEIEGGDAMLAECAFECGAAVTRFGCVISHIFSVVLLPVRALGDRCATLERKVVGRVFNCDQINSDGARTNPAHRRIEYFWLCGKCARPCT